MKNLITFLIIIFALSNCTKEQSKPTEQVQIEKTTTLNRMLVALNYSTTIDASGIKQSEIDIQGMDTTYYEISKNGVLMASWKANWTYNSKPGYNLINDLHDVFQYNAGDTILLYIVYKSPRNITNYTYNGGITIFKTSDQDFVNYFEGQHYAYELKPNQAGYETGKKCFYDAMRIIAP